MISELPQEDLSKLREAALDRSTKKKNNRLGREEDILRDDNANGTDQPNRVWIQTLVSFFRTRERGGRA
jgi:hypothetical protein